jgi:hypothetical protein
MVNSLLYQFKSRPHNKAARGTIRGKSEIRNKTNTLGKRAWRKERVGWNNYLNRLFSRLPGGRRRWYSSAHARTLHARHGDGRFVRDNNRHRRHSFGALLYVRLYVRVPARPQQDDGQHSGCGGRRNQPPAPGRSGRIRRHSSCVNRKGVTHPAESIGLLAALAARGDVMFHRGCFRVRQFGIDPSD